MAKCPNNTFINSNSFCVKATACPLNYYGDPINGVCTSDCPGNGSVELFADTNTYVKMCVYVCPDLFYIQNISGSRICVSACLPNYYINYVKKICVSTCSAGTYAYTNKTCLSSCPLGFYAD